METRDGQLFWYKNLGNRLNFSVPCQVKGVNKKNEEVIQEALMDPQEIFKRSAYRCEYNNVVFEPYLDEKIDTKKNYNLFTGFKNIFQSDFQVDRDKIEPILHHLRTVWCKESEELFEYLWMIIMSVAEGAGDAIHFILNKNEIQLYEIILDSINFKSFSRVSVSI